MGTQTRLMTAMEGVEGLPFDPTIRIPPIQDPSPLQVVSNHRPPPLEPSAAEGRRPTAVRLTSRSKALANARPINGNTPIKPLDTRHIADGNTASSQEDRQDLSPRKRQKVDYVQLPKPHQRRSAERVSSLDKIPKLNQLNEPPPSAARFPPITTNGTSPVLQRSEPVRHSKGKVVDAGGDKSRSEDSSGAPDTKKDDVTKKPKRVYTRGRRNWTEDETENLLKGVAKYGVGKWKRMMEDPEFQFPADRTAVDLKDRYRTCKLHEERRIERHASGQLDPDSKSTSGRAAKKTKDQVSADNTPTANETEEEEERENPKDSSQEKTISFAEVQTIKDVARSLATPSKSESKRWTAEEDADLSKGFQKYGFSWTSISKDPELSLQHRTGTQLRDRFRIKFPIHYQSSVPVELPETPPGKDRNKKRRRRPADPKNPRGGIKVILATPDSKGRPVESLQSTGSEQRSKTLTIADMTDDGVRELKLDRPSLPSMSSLCARLDAKPSESLYPGIDIQPLPDSDDEYEECGSDYYGENASDHGMSDRERDFAALSDGDDIGDVRVGTDVRHLSISGLLNETQEDVLRLPPFRSAYDDTNDLLDQGTVHLPPLSLWDDLAPRPMFELD